MTDKHKPTAYLYIPVVCNKSRDSGTLCKLRWEECCDVCEKESNKCTENKFGTCPVIPCRADCRSICDIWLSLEGLSSCGRLWLFRVFPHSKKRETFATTYRKKTTITLALRGLSNRSIHSKCQKIISILLSLRIFDRIIFLSDRYYIFFFHRNTIIKWSGIAYGGSDKGLEETHFEYMYDLLYNLVESGFILFYLLFFRNIYWCNDSVNENCFFF